MHWWQTVFQLSLLASTALPAAAASWGFADATVSVQTKGAGVGAGLKEEYDRYYCFILFLRRLISEMLIYVASDSESLRTALSLNPSLSVMRIP